MRFWKVLDSGRHNGNRRRGCALFVLAGVLGFTTAADAVPRVGIVGGTPDWCQLLIDNGYECDVLPPEGPASLEGYDIVILLTGPWTDPDGLLPAFMRSGRGIIALGNVPDILGIDTDPTVQAWIGANQSTNCGQMLRTIATDPILGDLQPGYALGFCENLPAIRDTTGHLGAKVLATDFDGSESGAIGIMRNRWEGGQSVYLGSILPLGFNPDHEMIFLNAVRVLSNPIPTVSEWGLVILTLLLATAGSAVLIRRRTHRAPAPA